MEGVVRNNQHNGAHSTRIFCNFFFAKQNLPCKPELVEWQTHSGARQCFGSIQVNEEVLEEQQEEGLVGCRVAIQPVILHNIIKNLLRGKMKRNLPER